MSEEKKASGLRLSDFKSDKRKVNGGVWVEVGGGAQILVARLPNDAHRDLVIRLMAPHRHFEQRGVDVPDDITRAIGLKAMAQTVLLGWRGIIDDDGTEIPYSVEEAMKALEIEDFAALVMTNAGNRKLYRADNEEDNTKN